ncbi:MAG: U32 family peptidase [Pseudomonadota bacterium]
MTDTKNQKVELLAPAGNFEKLEIAVHYGADAVYLAGKEFSLRNFSGNFTTDELSKAIPFAHSRGVKVYVACNIFPRNFELEAIAEHLKFLGELGPDAVIVSDPGVVTLAQDIIPHIPLHLSTQANTTNYKSALFWEKMGVKRINTARELSLEEIKTIASQSSLEIEAFVHGAMCISYSGRCLLSSFMADRESNRGMCSHPCRWKYAVVEALRPGEYYPIAEDDRGSYIFNSKDLCMIEHIPELVESGLTSLKIEGRMKGINYLASVVKVYREAIDAYYENPEAYGVKDTWLEELTKVSHRGYCTGFYFGHPEETMPNYSNRVCGSDYMFVGKVLSQEDKGRVRVEVRNKIFTGDEIEILTKQGPSRRDTIDDIIDAEGASITFAQPGSEVAIALSNSCLPNDLLRKRNTFSNLTKSY